MTVSGEVAYFEPRKIGIRTSSVLWLGVLIILTLALCVHLLGTGVSLPKRPSEERITIAAVVTHMLLGKRVPTDDRIIEEVYIVTGNTKFGRKDLAWYKTRARQGKLRGQGGKPHVINQRVARYHVTDQWFDDERG